MGRVRVGWAGWGGGVYEETGGSQLDVRMGWCGWEGMVPADAACKGVGWVKVFVRGKIGDGGAEVLRGGRRGRVLQYGSCGATCQDSAQNGCA